jgi:hypothetical protein
VPNRLWASYSRVPSAWTACSSSSSSGGGNRCSGQGLELLAEVLSADWLARSAYISHVQALVNPAVRQDRSRTC